MRCTLYVHVHVMYTSPAWDQETPPLCARAASPRTSSSEMWSTDIINSSHSLLYCLEKKAVFYVHLARRACFGLVIDVRDWSFFFSYIIDDSYFDNVSFAWNKRDKKLRLEELQNTFWRARQGIFRINSTIHLPPTGHETRAIAPSTCWWYIFHLVARIDLILHS